MPRRFRPGHRAAVLGILLLTALSACEIGYYSHLAVGQGKILLNTQSIHNLRSTPHLPDSTRSQLALVDSILAFAQSLGLHTGGSYTEYYDTKGQPISWNVSAAPKDALQPHLWHFPIVGSLPYKGFFERERAERTFADLQKAGYDAYLRPVNAYSTLGYFNDPLLSTMLDDPPEALAEVLLHELAHATIFVDGHTDFNESLATFVGQRGTLLFIAQHFGNDTSLIDKVHAQRRDAERFRLFVAGVVQSLDSLYSAGLALDEVLVRREEVFADAQTRFRPTLGQYANPRYDYFLTWQLNNARLLSFKRYQSKQDLFERVLSLHGGDMNAALSVFAACGKTDSPWNCLERSAVDQSPAPLDQSPEPQ